MGGYSKDHIVILDIDTETYFSSVLLDLFEELIGSQWVRYIGNASWFESKRQARQFMKEHRDFFRGKYIFLQEV